MELNLTLLNHMNRQTFIHRGSWGKRRREGQQEPEEKHLETCEMLWGPGMNNVDGTATWTWTGEEGSGHYHLAAGKQQAKQVNVRCCCDAKRGTLP